MRTLATHIHTLAIVNAGLDVTADMFLNICNVLALDLLPTAAFMRGFGCCVDKGLWCAAGHHITGRGNAYLEAMCMRIGRTLKHPDAKLVFHTQLGIVIHTLNHCIVDEKHKLSRLVKEDCVWRLCRPTVVLISSWTIYVSGCKPKPWLNT